MPAKSPAQFGLMLAALKGESSKVPKTVAKEYIERTPVKKRALFGSQLAKRRSIQPHTRFDPQEKKLYGI